MNATMGARCTLLRLRDSGLGLWRGLTGILIHASSYLLGHLNEFLHGQSVCLLSVVIHAYECPHLVRIKTRGLDFVKA